jgi:hypothetical protein
MAALTAAHASQHEHHRSGRVHLRDGRHAGLRRSRQDESGCDQMRNDVCVIETWRRPSTLPSKSNQPSAASGRSPDSCVDRCERPSRMRSSGESARTLSTYSGGAVPELHRLPKNTRRAVI